MLLCFPLDFCLGIFIEDYLKASGFKANRVILEHSCLAVVCVPVAFV